MVVLAFLSDPPVVERILRHLKLPSEPPHLAPARASRWSSFLLAIPTPVPENASLFDLPDSAAKVGAQEENGGSEGEPREEPPPIRPPPGDRGFLG